MKPLFRSAAPSIADMIRADHARVMFAFHRYSVHARPGVRRALAATICRLLEVHAQAEEEVFYAELRKAGSAVERDLGTEHEEMRRLITALRATPADDPSFDAVFMELMRTVIHHVADEETTVLPYAETHLAERLAPMGVRFMSRRAQLMASQLPAKKSLVMGAGALIAGVFVLRRLFRPAHRA
ncbi:MAG TPA: hemerythrin domain-containing protein [Burkholderiales bacterium]|nr:hemerythrin domain-containing protein [Burkholderiales bacterium]